VSYGGENKMRIALFDSWGQKFTKPLVKHWEDLGHEVKVNPTWEQAEYADKVIFYPCDNVPGEGTHKHKFNGQVYIFAVDIEIHAGQQNGVDWSKVTGCITMAKHIDEMVKTPDNVKRAIIRPGIDLTKYTLRPQNDFKDPIRRIAYVVGDGRIWDVKRFDISLQMLKDLLNKTPLIWQLHVRGTYSSHSQYNVYCKHLIKDLKLEDFVIWSDRVDDMNAWLDDKDYFLLPSTKEAFSYATAEAMAKGIKPVLGNWQSAKEVWGEYANETYLDMFYRFLDPDYLPQNYRKYIEDNYSQDRYFKQLDIFMGISQEVK
jgi:glycosyltransferase involved in cell wall biosynthesis